MLPQITLFNMTFATYGSMILIGFIVGMFVAVHRGKQYKYNIEEIDILFAGIYCAIGFLVGGKVLYLVLNIPVLWKNRWNLFSSITQVNHFLIGGFVFYGGLFGAMLMFLRYNNKFKIDRKSMAVILIPSIPLIHGFGRIGCFLAGCCYGIPYRGIGHVVFRHSHIAPNSISLFPVQMVEAGSDFVIFGVLYLIGRKKDNYHFVLGTYFILYSILRFFLEYARGDGGRGIVYTLSVSQWISILVLFLGIKVLRSGMKEHKEPGSEMQN